MDNSKTTLLSPCDMRVWACRVAAAFHVTRLHFTGDLANFTFVRDRGEGVVREAYSTSLLSRFDPASGTRFDYQMFLWCYAVTPRTLLWKGSCRSDLFQNEEEAEVFLLMGLRLLDLPDEERTRECFERESFTSRMWSHHQLLEARIAFQERLDKFLPLAFDVSYAADTSHVIGTPRAAGVSEQVNSYGHALVNIG